MSRAPDHSDLDALRAMLSRCQRQYVSIPMARKGSRMAVLLEQAMDGLEDAIDALVELRAGCTVIPFPIKQGASHDALS